MIKGQLTRKSRKIEPSVVSHVGDWDTLLVRAGHFLWKEYRKARSKAPFSRETLDLEAAIETMVSVKEAYRAPRRAKAKADHEASRERFKAWRERPKHDSRG